MTQAGDPGGSLRVGWDMHLVFTQLEPPRRAAYFITSATGEPQLATAVAGESNGHAYDASVVEYYRWPVDI